MNADSKVQYICIAPSVCVCIDVETEHVNNDAPITNNTSIGYMNTFTSEVCEDEEGVCVQYLSNSALSMQTPLSCCVCLVLFQKFEWKIWMEY